jgi:hypothetical protein
MDSTLAAIPFSGKKVTSLTQVIKSTDHSVHGVAPCIVQTLEECSIGHMEQKISNKL